MPHQMPNRSLVSYGTCYLEARLSLHHHPSMKLPFVRGGSRFELHRWAGGFDFLNCQTFAASPAEPGELLFWFRPRLLTTTKSCGVDALALVSRKEWPPTMAGENGVVRSGAQVSPRPFGSRGSGPLAA